MKKIIFIFFINITLFSQDKDAALEYLNNLRLSVGLSTLSHNQILENAAQNHANYLNNLLKTDNIFDGHYENYNTPYYTGQIPNERGIQAGYKAMYYSENLSAGQNNLINSIDGLMSAIYHRYGFLDNSIDEIGIGLNYDNEYKIYNYNMGNSLLNSLCSQKSYSGNLSYYYGVCSDFDFKIESSLYDETLNTLAVSSPDIVVWPPKNSIDIPTVFFDESPDPLPNSVVSGYPISIEFNSYKYNNNNISIETFQLFKEDGTEVLNTYLMSEENDPNSEHTKYQFSLFPLERLGHNQIYTVDVTYTIDEQEYYLKWNFLTRKFTYPYYEIENTTAILDLKTNTTYAIYLKPLNNNDVYSSWQLSYSTNQIPILEYVDGNTFLITLSGDIGQSCTVELSNGKRLTLKIANVDSANDSIEKTLHSEKDIVLKKGWNLVSANLDLSSLDEEIKIVWQYQNNQWYGYSKEYNITTLSNTKVENGTWILAQNDINITIPKSEENLSYDYPQGWSLAGTNKEINSTQISCNNNAFEYIWRYKNNSWQVNASSKYNTDGFEYFDIIDENDGFWVKCQ